MCVHVCVCVCVVSGGHGEALCLQYIQADRAVSVDIRVEQLRNEMYLGWLVWIVLGGGGIVERSPVTRDRARKCVDAMENAARAACSWPADLQPTALQDATHLRKLQCQFEGAAVPGSVIWPEYDGIPHHDVVLLWCGGHSHRRVLAQALLDAIHPGRPRLVSRNAAIIPRGLYDPPTPLPTHPPTPTPTHTPTHTLIQTRIHARAHFPPHRPTTSPGLAAKSKGRGQRWVGGTLKSFTSRFLASVVMLASVAGGRPPPRHPAPRLPAPSCPSRPSNTDRSPGRSSCRHDQRMPCSMPWSSDY